MTTSTGTGTANDATVVTDREAGGPDDPQRKVEAAERTLEKAREQLAWAEANLATTTAEAEAEAAAAIAEAEAKES